MTRPKKPPKHVWVVIDDYGHIYVSATTRKRAIEIFADDMAPDLFAATYRVVKYKLAEYG